MEDEAGGTGETRETRDVCSPPRVMGEMTREYLQFHKTWTQSDNIEIQMHSVPRDNGWHLTMHHDMRTKRCAGFNGFSPARFWRRLAQGIVELYETA